MSPPNKYPDHFRDCEKAFLYFVSHYDKFDFDPKRLAIVGKLVAILTNYHEMFDFDPTQLAIVGKSVVILTNFHEKFDFDPTFLAVVCSLCQD